LRILLLTVLLTIFTFVGLADAPVSRYETYIATAYSLKGITASGERVRSGIIAADPRVLPIGSKVHIQGMGNYTVKDTGGKIKGRKVDIWMANRKAAIQFGRRAVQLKVLR
jgi:3D (Asp-Asp-Asp) domain-containing protein